MKPTPEATYERSRRLASMLAKTVRLQCQRIQSDEPGDSDFVLRRWADYEFLINALSRLRRIAFLAAKVPPIQSGMELAISEFDEILPNLLTMRNTLEHIDEYALDDGRNPAVSRKALEVGTFSNDELEWLGHSLKLDDAIKATNSLFKALISAHDLLQGRITNGLNGA